MTDVPRRSLGSAAHAICGIQDVAAPAQVSLGGTLAVLRGSGSAGCAFRSEARHLVALAALLDEVGKDDGVAKVPGLLIELAAAGDEAQLGSPGGAVDGTGGKCGLVEADDSVNDERG